MRRLTDIALRQLRAALTDLEGGHMGLVQVLDAALTCLTEPRNERAQHARSLPLITSCPSSPELSWQALLLRPAAEQAASRLPAFLRKMRVELAPLGRLLLARASYPTFG